MQAVNPALPGSVERLLRYRSNGSYSRTISVVLLVPAGLLALFYVGSLTSVSVFDYALASAAKASGAIVVVGPFVALSAAYEMRVLRALWGQLDVRLPWYRVAFGRLWPVAGAGVLAMGASYAAMGAAGSSSLMSPGWYYYPLVSLFGVFAWMSVGAALGLLFRPLVAVPLAAITPYLVVTLPGGWEPLWLRHLTGLLFDCCSTSDVLDRRAVVASTGILLAFGLVGWMLIFLRLGALSPSPSPFAAGSVLTAGLVLLAVTQASHLGAAPTAQRPLNALECSGQVCLWPEDARARQANEAAWPKVRLAWTELGLPLRQTAIGPVSGPEMLDVVVLTEDPRAAAASMAQALPRAALGCRERYQDEAGNLAADQLALLLLQRVGESDPTLQESIQPGSAPTPADAPNLYRTLGRC